MLCEKFRAYIIKEKRLKTSEVNIHSKKLENTTVRAKKKLSVVVHICNPSTWEAEAGGSQIGSQPGLHSEILYQKKKEITP
jgi:hypothetical protein